MFNILINKTIIGFYSVRVIEKEACFDLTDTVVVKLLKNEILQIIIEDPFKKIVNIIDESDLEIWGDFDPVEIKLIPLKLTWLKTPFFTSVPTLNRINSIA